MIPNMATHGFLKKSVDGWKDTPVSKAAIAWFAVNAFCKDVARLKELIFNG